MIRILIVDDDPGLRGALMNYASQELNAIVSEASSGNDAIRLLAEGHHFDVIISDYCMDDGNGSDLLRYLTEKEIGSFSALYTSVRNPALHSTNEWFLGRFDKLDFASLLLRIRNALSAGHSRSFMSISQG